MRADRGSRPETDRGALVSARPHPSTRVGARSTHGPFHEARSIPPHTGAHVGTPSAVHPIEGQNAPRLIVTSSARETTATSDMDPRDRADFYGQGGGGHPHPIPPMHPGHPGDDTPHHPDGGWGPSDEPVTSVRQKLAQQRQADYNEHLARQGQGHNARPPMRDVDDNVPGHQHQAQFHNQGAGNGGRPAAGMHARGGDNRGRGFEESPGMVFGDEEIQPRRKGSGMKDMYGVNSDQKRRMRQEERKRQYASELQAQIAERERKKREDKARDRAAEHNAQAFGDAIYDMRDGRHDGRGGPGQWDMRRGQSNFNNNNAQPPPPQQQRQNMQQHYPSMDDVEEETPMPHRPIPYDDDGGYNQRGPPQQQQQGGGVGLPGMGGGPDALAQQQRAAVARKKAEYQAALQQQIREKAERKEREKREISQREMREEREAANYNPWGRGGGGAPMRDNMGNLATDLRHMRQDNEERAMMPNPGAHNLGPPSHQTQPQGDYPPQGYYDQGPPDPQGYPQHGGDMHPPYGGTPTHAPQRGQMGGGGGGRFQIGGAANPGPPPNMGARGNFSARENAHPHELEAKARAQAELQHALKMQIEEKERKKEEERRRVEEEDLADERRMQVEQERLREAFEREQELEREKAEERMRAEEEAYNLAANKRAAQKNADVAPPRRPQAQPPAQQEPSPRQSEGGPPPSGGGGGGGGRLPPRSSGPPPTGQTEDGRLRSPGGYPLRGPTPAGARELAQLRAELQAEHQQLVKIMEAQNVNMAMLQRRAESAEKHSAEARVELAELRENLSDQVFMSQLPGGPQYGEGIARTGAGENAILAHGVDVPSYVSKHDPINGVPHISSDADYGAFIRDAVGDGGGDMGPQLDGPGDGNSGFVAVGGGGALGYMGELGIAESSMRQSIDDNQSIAGDSSFIFPGQTMERAPWLDGAAGEGPGAAARGKAPVNAVGGAGKPPIAPAPGARPAFITDDGDEGLFGLDRVDSKPYHSGGDAFDDDDDLVRAGVGTEADDAPAFPAMRKEGFFGEDGEEVSAETLAMHGTVTNASKMLDAVYKKNEARMRALGLAEDGAGFNDQGPGGLDGLRGPRNPDDVGELDGMLQKFLKANRGGTPSGLDHPPLLEDGEFDGPGFGDERLRMIQHPDDDEDVFARPDTQVSMEADTRFITGH